MSITTVSWRIPFKMEMQHHKEWNIQKQNRQMKLHFWIANRYHPKSPKQRSLQLRCLWFFHLPQSPDAHQELHTCCASPLWNTPAACRENTGHSNHVWRPSFSIFSTLKTWDNRNIWYHGKSKLLETFIPSHLPFILNFQNSYESIWKQVVGKVPMFISCDLSANANKI